MEDDPELEMMLFENDDNVILYPDTEYFEPAASLSDRWANWVNVVNR